MFDVLVYLFENYAGPNEAPKDPDELRARLADAGFEGDEIDEALSWLDTLRNGEALSPSWRIPPAGGSVRSSIAPCRSTTSTRCSSRRSSIPADAIVDVPVSGGRGPAMIRESTRHPAWIEGAMARR